MNKEVLFCFFVSLTILTGCSVSPNYVNINKGDVGSKSIEINGECSEKCRGIISGYIESENILSPNSEEINFSPYLILLEVDGTKGSVSRHYDTNGSFNGGWSGDFIVYTKPGQNTLLINPQGNKRSPNGNMAIEFTSEEGSVYSLGSINSRTSIDNLTIFYWMPLVVNMTENVIAYPTKEAEWSKYCVKWLGGEAVVPTVCPK